MRHHVEHRAIRTRALLAEAANEPLKLAGTVFFALVFLFGSSSPQAWAAASINDLTGPWQLLVDDYPVAFKTNVVRTYHPLQKYAGNPVLPPTEPWEESLVYLYGTVLRDESGTGYRVWYHTLRTNNNICTNWSVDLYATSTNGINWVKPALNLRSTCGSASNNMYSTRPTGGGITSVIHTPWETDPAQRYKLMNFDTGGYWGAWSSNGVNIVDAPNNPVFTGGSDVGQFCWDPHTQQYLGYVKNGWYDANGLPRRAVALTTTTNITTWPKESLILWPDAYDDRWSTNPIQRTHFYGLSAFPYESMYLGFLWIFQATNMAQGNPGYLIGPIFDELVSSHDGVNWTREEAPRPPILPLGTNGTWDRCMVFTARAPVVDGDTIKVWYGGFDQMHDYNYAITHGAIGLATLRKDGFASLDAVATTGTVLTKALSGAGGALQVNYQANTGGSLKVEVCDVNYNVLSGYSQADCVPLTSGSITQAVTWTAHTQLPTGISLLRLRFVLQNASLYSFMAGASIVVMQPPTITQQPVNQTIAVGGSASFAVSSSGATPLAYQWQKNQINLSDGGHASGCTTATLTITTADSSDTGVYRCVVTNAYGSATSSPASLTVGKNTFGSVTFTNIPALSGDTTNEARAVTPDGRWVVGISGVRGFFYDVSGANVYVASNGAQELDPAVGVCYRTEGSQKEVIVGGLSSGWDSSLMTTNGTGFSSVDRYMYGTSAQRPVQGLTNMRAAGGGDVFFDAWWDVQSLGQVLVGKFAGAWPAALKPTAGRWDIASVGIGASVSVNAIGGTGRAVGYWGSAIRVFDWTGTGAATAWAFNGLDSTTAGGAWAVSANGTIIFGNSPIAGNGNYFGFKAVFATTMPGPANQLSINQLPNFPDTAGSTVLAVPYGCTPDGKYAVGMNYRGLEKAVLWDTSDPNPARWTVVDLTDVAAVNGILTGLARLTRAYSVGTNAAGALVIVGVGVDTNSPPNRHAFLMTVAPPLAPIAFPPTVTISGLSPAGFTCSFLSLANPSITCYLEYTTNLVPPSTWTTVASTPSLGALTSLSDPNPADRQRFYRIRIQ